MNLNYQEQVSVSIAGHCYLYKLNEPLTHSYFSGFRTVLESCLTEIKAEKKEIHHFYNLSEEFKSLSQAEFWCLLEPTAMALLKNNCCIFHAVAFTYKGKAWLFTAPSGTGKSTQYHNWKECFGNDVKIINGDKPVLRLNDDRSIDVYPSPWRGKERYGSHISAPLGGIVYLEQGTENRICKMHSSESIPVLLNAFWGRPETEDQIVQMCNITDSIVDQYPVWKLINRGDLESVKYAQHEFEESLILRKQQ